MVTAPCWHMVARRMCMHAYTGLVVWCSGFGLLGQSCCLRRQISGLTVWPSCTHRACHLLRSFGRAMQYCQTLHTLTGPPKYRLARSSSNHGYTACCQFTGHSVLVNTSFNEKGQPILNSIKQAVGLFDDHEDIRALLIEDWWFGAKEDALLRSESSFGPVQFQDTANADHASASDPEY